MMGLPCALHEDTLALFGTSGTELALCLYQALLFTLM